MTAQVLLAWWNLIYAVPFLLAVIYLVVYAASGLTFGDHDLAADHDADADADVDADADADVDVDADADVADHDVDHDVDHDLDHDHEAGGSRAVDHTARAGRGISAAADAPFFLHVLTWLGLGRVPMSIVLMVLMLTWGVVGFVTNQILAPVVPWGWMVLAISLPAAGLSSILMTRGVVRLMSRWLPTTETSAEPLAKLVGRSGEALYGIDQAFGKVAIRDHQGDLFQVPCRVYPDRQPIAKGQRVLLVDYDASDKLFYVTEDDLGMK